MAITKFLLPTLALVASTYAQCSSDETLTISVPSAIPTGCTTYEGDILVQSGAANAGQIDFGQIRRIEGNFEYSTDATVRQINFANLQEVTGDFSYLNLSQLTNTGLGALTTIGGTLNLTGLSSLTRLGLTAPLESVNTVNIVNTMINSFAGISNVSDISLLFISDNRQLGDISLDVESIENVTIGVNREDNGGQSVSFPNLQTANRIVIRNSSSVDMSNLVNASVGLAFIGNTFDSLEMDSLESTGALVITSNGELQNVSFTALTEITDGALSIENNTALNEITGFPLLTDVNGAVRFAGNFTRITLPVIENIQGAFNVRSSDPNFECGPIESLGGVGGSVECQADDPTAITNSDGSAAGQGGSGGDEGFAAPVTIPTGLLTGFALVAGIFTLFM